MKLTYCNFILPLKEAVNALGRRGLPIHEPTRKELFARVSSEAATLQADINSAVGYHLNVSSGDVNHFLFNDLLLKRPRKFGPAKTKDQADEEVLKALYATYGLDILLLILELRSKDKIISTYLDPAKFLPTSPTWSKFLCQYKIATKTLRLSSAATNSGLGGNFQNIPKRKGKYIRNMVTAPEGKLILAADLSRAEVWSTGVAAGAAGLLDLLRKGVDIHKFNGDNIYAGLSSDLQAKLDLLSEEKEQDMARVLGKTLAHAWDYGASIHRTVETASTVLGIKLTKDQAIAAKEAYFAKIPELKAWHEQIILNLYTTGEITTRYGTSRRIYETLPEYGQHTGNEKVFHEYFAQEPQSTVGIYTNLILLRCDYMGLKAGRELRAQIHDELLFIINEDDVDKTVKIIQEANSYPIPGTEVIIPMDIEVGKQWGKLKKLGE